jgi:putative adenylate-forming enzyme
MKQADASRSWTKEQLVSHQELMLSRLRCHSYQHSRFYQEFHTGLQRAPLPDLPILSKADVMRHFDEIVTHPAVCLRDLETYLVQGGDGLFLDRFVANATSGTTGRRCLLLFDSDEWAAVLGSYIRPATWNASDILANFTARRAHVVSTQKSHQTMRASSAASFFPTLRLDASGPVHDLVAKLNEWHPQILSTYAALARILADEQLTGRLSISPQRVFLGGEALRNESRQRMEQAWGPVITNVYAATEGAVMGVECPSGGLHLCEDLIVFEVVDGDGRSVPPGEYGERLLITPLFRRTMPLIRYEITDMLRLSPDNCPCGRPFRLIDDIQGRVEEVMYLPSLDGNRIPIHPVVFHSVLDSVPATAWRVIQKADAIEISLAGLPEGFNDANVAHTIHEKLRSQGIVQPPIRVLKVAAIERGASGKAPLIQANPPCITVP